MWNYFIVLLLGCAQVQAAEVGSGADGERADSRPQLGYFFLNDIIPVEEAKLYVAEGYQQLIDRVRPYMVELLATEQTASGVILGFNKKNQPIILTAGHVLMYNNFELLNVTRISLDQPHGNPIGSIVDEKSHVVLPAWRGENSVTSKGWYGLSMFHPPYTVNESLIMRDQVMNFGLYLMTGNTVDIAVGETNLDAKYTVREAIDTPIASRPALGPLKTARLQKLPLTKSTPVGTRVLVMGVSKPLAESVPKMAFVFSQVQSDKVSENISRKYVLNLDTNIQYFLLGEFEKTMAGGGVFNEIGELVGIVTKVVRDRAGKSVGAIVLDVEHILQSITDLSNQSEVLKIVTDVQSSGRGFGRQCRVLFAN